MGLLAPTLTGLLTVQQAADRLGVTRWDVVRLVQTGAIQSVVLIEAASLDTIEEQS